MSLSVDRSQMLNCPRCGNHCPVGELKCGKGREYFGTGAKGRDHDRKHKHRRPEGSLSALLHQCGRFARHSELEEDALLQPLTGEEQAQLRSLLEKLSGGWRERYGEEAFDRHHKEKHRHKHSGHDN